MSACSEQALVSVSTGVMNCLVAKLTALIDEEHVKFSNVPKEVSFLRDELSTMKAFLETLADRGNLDPLTREWRNQVREMAYEIEDWIDEGMHYLTKDEDNSGFISKIIHRVNRMRTQNRMANQMKELKTRVVEMSHQHKRYKLDESISTSDYIAIDRRLCTLYADTEALVGIDGPRNDITKRLMGSDHHLMVVSIVGIGGLGKTTLANEVYKKIGGQFDCRAFMSISHKPDITRIVSNILSQLGQTSSPSCEVQDLLNNLRHHLLGKRYLIIIDDLWDKSAWDILRCAFPQNNHASRVITTTRIEKVAMECCSYRCEFIYKMEPLNEQDSKRLFLNRIFGSEDA
ncbi:disease resistance protein RGA5-like [Oryza brachyantha]|uniref:disease resistance protein RGA5-like n=1 Tax=Oryza brachyantha TaxID=4533 RepID=UPI001ADBDB77|nr:disease resistance protein RGA5-like [Oryza brachyantha]